MPEELTVPTTESAAPSAPPSTETAVATPAPPAEIIAPEGAEPQFTSNQDKAEYLRSKIGWNEKQAAKTPEQVAADEKAKADKAAAPVAAPAKTPEEVAAEQKTADDKAAADKAEAEKRAAAVDPLDKIGPLPAEKIAAALTADPDLETKLAAAGLSKDALITASREAAVASQFKELFPTLEIAQVAKQGSENFAILDQQFPAIKDEQTYNDFMMNTLVPMSYIRDDQGNPIPDANVPGTFQTDGSVARFIKMSNDVEFGQLQKIGDLLLANNPSEEQKEYAQNLKAAVDYIQDFRNNGYRIPGTPSGEKPAALPPDVQARLDRADRIEREAAERDTKASREKADSFEDKVSDSTVEQMSPLIKELLDQATALTDLEKETIAERVWKDLADTLSDNTGYKQVADQMMSRKELSDAVRDRRVAHNVTSMKAIYIGLVDKHLQKVGASRVSKNQALHAKIATQKETARMEPKTGTSASTSAPTLTTDDQLHQKARELARAESQGAEPTHAEFVRALTKLRLQQIA